ncbi:cytochrome P450 [Micromonospora polyrhachis]|uniref:Cytochrome P450 n=1 Tax=Micromonospora polyrhachis TaxID=1282883 RepID=A0A7W7WT68_9ACTN|nr:cytochrome P450 [Micromonospora polyrhachis]MBB4962372.1 cytochrome P450 [Micromonospora polyrhachis]
MTNLVHEFDQYADIQAALADPHLVPPPPGARGPVGSIAWLRATVARFSAGETHTRRRALVEADLARLDPVALRKAVAADPDDDARRATVRALTHALEIPEPDAVVTVITTLAGAYFGDAHDPAADQAVTKLLTLMLPTDRRDDSALEAAANRIGLLVQACDATGNLIDHARRAAHDRPAEDDIETMLVETLRHDPPIRTMRRVAIRDTHIAGVDIAKGDLVILDIAAANRDPKIFTDPETFDPERTGPPPLTFGGPPRRCPGRDHAMAIAAGALRADPDAPATDDRDPATMITAMVEHVLALATTWTAWDGHPRLIGDRIYTPHKAIRRVADHLVDHLAEMEARLAGEPTLPDHWHASATTTKADLAPFTQADLDETHSRLHRLARIWTNRLSDLTPKQLDHSPGAGWTFRQLAFHLAGSVYYADAVGDLTPTEGP